MADFIDKMKVGFNKGVATISTGSKTMVEKTKINSVINNLEADKKRLCESIGFTLLEFCKQNPETDFPYGEMVSFCDKMAQYNQEIDVQKIKLAELDAEMNRVLGATNSAEQVFCGCGYANVVGSRFCAKCGSKLESF